MIVCINNKKHRNIGDINNNDNITNNNHNKFQLLGTRRKRQQRFDKN